ncbi:MAG: poly(A)-specific ribonuclease [Thelocarpon superellum]|nr:MAG: poly(A)-specific ribonuclease [Thelocarpon superellum]
MEADWDEVARTAFPPPGIHALPTPVSVLAFDSNQELLWTGNEYGRVTSFYGPDLQKYTSFRAHLSHEGPVRQLLFNNKGVISIASKSVHLSLRRGLAQWTLTHENMTDLRCMSYTSKGTSEILVAGMQPWMFLIDVDRGVITKELSRDQIPTDHAYTLMKRSRYICAATSTGTVDLLDATTFQLIKSWKAHAAAINDMDAQNNFLVTCGFSPRQQQSFMLDPLANVFDLKTMMPLPPIPFHAGAAYVRMHPRMSTTGIVASQNGQMQVVDLMNPNTVNLRHAIVSSYLTQLELAPSGEALALADADCSIQLWGSPSKVHFAEFSNSTEFADVPTTPAPVDWYPDTPLNVVGLPYYREQLLSAWPSHLTFDLGGLPPKIDPEILAAMTHTEFGGYASNPGRGRRNQVDKGRLMEKDNVPLMAPKFLSEKARDAASSNKVERRPSDIAEALGTVMLNDGLKAEVPAMYRNVEIKYSKFGVDDFDFEYYNKTAYSGLEIHIANSYSNPLLQLYRFTPLLRNLALQHTATGCLSGSCLLCEMGFLFNMLESASGQNCQATNLLKTFSNLPQASALGLLEEESPAGSLPSMIQVLNRFLLERISTDYRQMLPQSPALDQTVAMAAVTTIRCVKCQSETIREGGTVVNELAYPSHHSLKGHRPSFSQIVKASVERETQTRGWCDKCRRYQSLSTRKTIQAVPDVFFLNTAVNSAEARQAWATPGWLPTEIGIIVEGGQLFCYEGEDLRLHLQRGIHAITVYCLVGLVAAIVSGDHQAPHLVALVDVHHSGPESERSSDWHLFNDFLVRKIPEEEALRFHGSWKLPSILAYQVKKGSHAVDNSWKENLDPTILYHDISYTQPTMQQGTPYRLLSAQTEAPTAGTHVAIDAEFIAFQQEEIEIKADGSRETIRPSRLGLARVSVLRGSGEDEGLPFIDDYIATTEPVVDYLTAFSGIQAGDLDPARSRHNLIPLKIAYKKLWLLLNLGCIFVGHGLPKDFRTINMHVPKGQVIDTVDLFFIKARQRKLSLRFLAWFLLREDIQTETHDSIEDARTALKLYRKYQEFDDAGVLENIILDIYARGREVNYKAPSALPTTTTSSSGTGTGTGTGNTAGTGTGDGDGGGGSSVGSESTPTKTRNGATTSSTSGRQDPPGWLPQRIQGTLSGASRTWTPSSVAEK